MRRDDAAYLLDMLLAAQDAMSHISGLTREQFGQTRLHQDALFKALETVGEAARQVSDPMRDAHPEIPWFQIIGMRNRLVHAYFEVDLQQVWDTVQQDIPHLVALLLPLVPREE